jgi:hypothetical protein
VLDEIPHVGEIRAVIPACVLDLVGPPGASQAVLQIVEGRLRHIHHEGAYFHRSRLLQSKYGCCASSISVLWLVSVTT